jgi:hypothetical protein
MDSIDSEKLGILMKFEPADRWTAEIWTPQPQFVTLISQVSGRQSGCVRSKPGVDAVTQWCVTLVVMFVNCQSQPPTR